MVPPTDLPTLMSLSSILILIPSHITLLYFNASTAQALMHYRGQESFLTFLIFSNNNPVAPFTTLKFLDKISIVCLIGYQQLSSFTKIAYKFAFFFVQVLILHPCSCLLLTQFLFLTWNTLPTFWKLCSNPP